MRILFPVIHFLLEGLCLFLITERECCQAFLQLEGMKKDAVLIVRKCVVEFLIPNDASVGRRDIDKLDPECISYQVIGQYGSTLQACVRPSVPVRIGNVQLGYGDGVDLVGGLGHSALDRLLVFVREDRGHGGGSGSRELKMPKNGGKGEKGWS